MMIVKLDLKNHEQRQYNNIDSIEANEKTRFLLLLREDMVIAINMDEILAYTIQEKENDLSG